MSLMPSSPEALTKAEICRHLRKRGWRRSNWLWTNLRPGYLAIAKQGVSLREAASLEALLASEDLTERPRLWTDMKTKIVIIGQTAIACFQNEQAMDDWRHSGNSPVGPLYTGKASKVKHERYAPLHPDFMAYYEAALAIKYRGTNKLRTGTESAQMAFMDCLPLGTKYVVIWNPLTHEEK